MLLIWLVASVGTASVLYVSPSGGGHACKEAEPCALATAVSIISAPNTTIMFYDGEYYVNETIVVRDRALALRAVRMVVWPPPVTLWSEVAVTLRARNSSIELYGLHTTAQADELGGFDMTTSTLVAITGCLFTRLDGANSASAVVVGVHPGGTLSVRDSAFIGNGPLGLRVSRTAVFVSPMPIRRDLAGANGNYECVAVALLLEALMVSVAA